MVLKAYYSPMVKEEVIYPNSPRQMNTQHRWDTQQFAIHIYSQDRRLNAMWSWVKKQRLREAGFVVTKRWGDPWLPQVCLNNSQGWQGNYACCSRIGRVLVCLFTWIRQGVWLRDLIQGGRMGRGTGSLAIGSPQDFHRYQGST